MITLELTNADARLVAEALQFTRNRHKALAKYTGVKPRRRDSLRQKAIKADRIKLRIEAKLGE